MAFPFLFQDNFESGDFSEWSHQEDTLGRLSVIDHHDGLDISPAYGGYVMKVDLNRGYTPGSFIRHDTALDLTAGNSRFIRFFLRASRDFWMAPGAGVTCLLVESGAEAAEEWSFRISRDVLLKTPRLCIRSPDFNDTIDGLFMPLDTWIPVELSIFHTNPSSRVSLHYGENTLQVNGFNFDDFTSIKLGAMSQSADIRGSLYFDDFIIDSSRLETPLYISADNRSGQSMLFTRSSYVFVGPGKLRGATLISGGTNNTAFLYDADRLPLAYHDIKAGLRCAVAESKDSLVEAIEFKRGCYLVMSGTNPQVIVHYGDIG